MTSTLHLAGLLAEQDRRLTFAAVVLGATDAAAVAARSGLPLRAVVGALRRLRDAGLVTGDNTTLRVDEELLRAVARAESAAGQPAPDADAVPPGPAASILRTFVTGGRLTRLPAQHSRRQVVLEHVVGRSFEPGVRYPESAVNAILRDWCAGGQTDHVALRRYLVDSMLLAREHGVYWRIGPATPSR